MFIKLFEVFIYHTSKLFFDHCYFLVKEECADGPHLHFSVRYLSGKPKHINGLIIGGYRIKTGRNSYDSGCGPENCKAVMSDNDVARSCSTILTRLDNDVPSDDQERYCVSIGGNVGMFANINPFL